MKQPHDNLPKALGDDPAPQPHGVPPGLVFLEPSYFVRVSDIVAVRAGDPRGDEPMLERNAIVHMNSGERLQTETTVLQVVCLLDEHARQADTQEMWRRIHAENRLAEEAAQRESARMARAAREAREARAAREAS